MLYLSACSYRVVDVISRFKIEGVVLEQNNNPLSGVTLYFVDNGLDQWRRNLGEALLIGRTDGEGKLSKGFSYSWGYRTRKDSQPDVPGTFYLLLELDGYEFVREEFNIKALPRLEDHEVLVEFSIVMAKEKLSEDKDP